MTVLTSIFESPSTLLTILSKFMCLTLFIFAWIIFHLLSVPFGSWINGFVLVFLTVSFWNILIKFPLFTLTKYLWHKKVSTHRQIGYCSQQFLHLHTYYNWFFDTIFVYQIKSNIMGMSQQFCHEIITTRCHDCKRAFT